MDTSKITKLGPVAVVLSQILKDGCMEEKRIDRIPKGSEDEFNTEDLGYFTKSYLVFKGCPMRSDWIKGWKNQVGVPHGQDS